MLLLRLLMLLQKTGFSMFVSYSFVFDLYCKIKT
jgi:hypothetical protein